MTPSIRQPFIGWAKAVDAWGSTADERAERVVGDSLLADPDSVLFRAVDVDAPTELVFRWLCQLRAAPYSYDWIDNRGRRSPRELTPGLEEIEVGQTFMIFRLAHVEPGRSITLDSTTALFGRVVVTYRVTDRGRNRSRLVVKVLVRYRSGVGGSLMRAMLPAGDLVMMRRQLLTLRGLAERDARRLAPAPN